MREEIIKIMVEMIRERMGCDVVTKDVPKNNGTVKKAIMIIEEGEEEVRITPTIYIDDMVAEIEANKWSIAAAVDEVINLHRNNKELGNVKYIISKLSKEIILENVQYQLVNKCLNKARLETVPYKEFLDLAVLYRSIIERTEDGTAGFVINNQLCEKYEISQEELEEAAKRNMAKETFKVTNIAEILLISIFDETPMYVCSNESGINGATIMLDTKYFKELSEKLGEDLIILPSSIHEVIAVPKLPEVELEALREMVKDINGTQLAAEEVLGDSVYKYIREDDKITIA